MRLQIIIRYIGDFRPMLVPSFPASISSDRLPDEQGCDGYDDEDYEYWLHILTYAFV